MLSDLYFHVKKFSLHSLQKFHHFNVCFRCNGLAGNFLAKNASHGNLCVKVCKLPRRGSQQWQIGLSLIDSCWWELEGSRRGCWPRTWELNEYLQTWKLKLCMTKTASAVFQLNNKETKRELKVNHNNETLPFCSGSRYPGVSLTGRSRIADTLSHFAKSWYHELHSWGGLLAPAGVLE